MTGALRNRSFRWIASLIAIDASLEWFGTIALMALVYQRTDSTSAAAGLLICKQIAPGAIVSLASVRLDRFSVGRSLTWAFLLQAVSLLAIAVVGFGPLLFILAAVTGAAGTLVRSLLRAGTAVALEDQQLRSGNALTNIIVAVTSLAGPAVAAAVVAMAGASTSLVVAGVMTLICTAVAAAMPAHPPRASPAASASPDARDSVDGAERQVPVVALLAIAAVLLCAFAMDEPTLLAYSEHSLGAGVRGYGAIFAAWGAGLTLGGIAFSRLLHVPMLRLALATQVVVALAYLGLGVAPSIEWACAIAVIGGIGNGAGFVALATAVQEAAPRGREASTAARFESVVTVAPAIGIVLGGVLADLATPRIALVVPGVVALIAVAIVSFLLRTSGRPVVAPRALFWPTTGGSA